MSLEVSQATHCHSRHLGTSCYSNSHTACAHWIHITVTEEYKSHFDSLMVFTVTAASDYLVTPIVNSV